jgi:O-antigen ligase
VLAEQGIVGLLALVGMLACGIIAACKLACSSANDTGYLGAAALTSLLVMCSAGVVELSLVREWVVTTLFLLLGIIGCLLTSAAVVPSTERHKK